MPSKPLTLTILAICFVLALSGCDRENDTEKTNGTDKNMDSKSVVQDAESNYSEMEKKTQDLISKMKESEKAELETGADELQDELNQAKQKFTELQQADQENMQQAREEFNNAINELKQSYEEAQAKMNNNK